MLLVLVAARVVSASWRHLIGKQQMTALALAHLLHGPLQSIPAAHGSSMPGVDVLLLPPSQDWARQQAH